VKASTVRIASRAANALRAGYAARSWDDLRNCRLVLVSAESEKLEALLREMAESLDHWKRRSVVLVASDSDSRALAMLARRGASVASIHLLGDPVEPFVFLEGESRAVREVRRRLQNRPLVIRRGAAALPAIAAAELGLVVPPLLDAALSALRHAGLNPVQAWRVLDVFVALPLRSFRKSGIRALREPPVRLSRSQFLNQLEELRTVHPRAAEFLVDAVSAVFKRVSRDAKSLRAHS
jgi:hypothetical protein